MQNTVALVDLQGYALELSQLTAMLAKYDTVYLFHCKNQCSFSLTTLNELATLINSGQVIILDLPQNCRQEYQYAVLVGQMLVLLDLELSVTLYSAQLQATQLLQLFQQATIKCTLQQLHANAHTVVPTAAEWGGVDLTWTQRACVALELLLQPIQNHRLFIDYAPLALRKGFAKLSNTGNTLNLQQVESRDDVPNLNIHEAVADQVQTPAQQLRQGIEALIDQGGKKPSTLLHEKEDSLLEDDLSNLHFHPSDQIHFELLLQLREKQVVMPKDIYSLKDLLTEVFPEADASLIIKALIKRGYIHWNGHEVTYSYEMYLN